MHIHELIAFQGQLLSVKNPYIMNYCMKGGPGFGAGLQSSKLLQSLQLALKEMLPNVPAFGHAWGDALPEGRNPLAPRLRRVGHPCSMPGELRQVIFPGVTRQT